MLLPVAFIIIMVAWEREKNLDLRGFGGKNVT